MVPENITPEDWYGGPEPVEHSILEPSSDTSYKHIFMMISRAEEFLTNDEKWDELQSTQQAILATKTDRLNRLALHRIVNGHSGMQLMKLKDIK